MNRKRNLIYLACGLVFLLAVIFKQAMITSKRNEKIVSAFSEWQQYGKPVVVETIQKKDVLSYTKVTAWQLDSHTFKGHTSKTVRDQLRIGQEMVFKYEKLKHKGVISKIADEISLDTGMYAIQVSFEDSFDSPEWVVAYAHTGTIKDVIDIPNEVIEKNGEEFLVWKVEDGRAVKQTVTIQQRDGYGAIVGSGIQEGDMVVFEGFTQLNEGDKVRIVKEYTEENKDD